MTRLICIQVIYLILSYYKDIFKNLMLPVLTNIIANITNQERKTVGYCKDNTFKVYYLSPKNFLS